VSTHSVEKTSAKTFKEKVEVALDLGCHISVTSELFQEMIKRIEELETTEISLIVQKAAAEAHKSISAKLLLEKDELLNATQKALKEATTDYNEKDKMLIKTVGEMKDLALSLDKQAVKIYKIRDSNQTVTINQTEKYMLDKAQELRMFLLMNDLI